MNHPLSPHLQAIARRAAALLEAGSCAGVEAQTESGIPTAFFSAEATRFCLVGALQRARLDYQRAEAVPGFIPLDPLAEALLVDKMKWNHFRTFPAQSLIIAWDGATSLGRDDMVAALKSLGDPQ